MSFIYPRTIDILRPVAAADAGDIGYSGLQSGQTTPVVSGLPCSIQFKRPSGALAANLPADVVSKSIWIILIPLAACALGTINDRDIVIDDLGVRYQVSNDYWNSLGYRLEVERLES